MEIVKMIDEIPEICDICKLQEYITRNCPTLPAFKDVLNEQANALTFFLN